MKKPKFISHYLVLKDLLNGKDVRMFSDVVFYLTSRIENIKCELKDEGIEFVEDIKKETNYSYYKPYILLPTKENINKAEQLMKLYATDNVIDFLAQNKLVNRNIKIKKRG